MNALIQMLAKSGLLTQDLDYHLIRALDGPHIRAFRLPEMVRIRGAGPDSVYQQRPADLLAVSGLRYPRRPVGFWAFRNGCSASSCSWDFGTSELGILGALGSVATFFGTVTIIPFMPNGWEARCGFPAMAGNVPFLMKDVVLLAASIYLLKQGVVRVLEAGASTSVALSQT